jgi:hypothetical protein
MVCGVEWANNPTEFHYKVLGRRIECAAYAARRMISGNLGGPAENTKISVRPTGEC